MNGKESEETALFVSLELGGLAEGDLLASDVDLELVIVSGGDYRPISDFVILGNGVSCGLKLLTAKHGTSMQTRNKDICVRSYIISQDEKKINDFPAEWA